MIKANIIFVLILTTALLTISDFNKSVNEVSENLSFCDTIHVELQALYDWSPDCTGSNFVVYNSISFYVIKSSCLINDSIYVKVPCYPHVVQNMKINKGEIYNLKLTRKNGVFLYSNTYDIIY